ncbi:MFS general substrate transporter [Aspergillus heterothallicus]
MADSDVKYTTPANLDPEKDAIDDKDGLGKGLQPTASTSLGEMDGSEYTDAQYKKLLRKIDAYLIPMMFFCYGIQQTDKTSISIQALFGMETDLGLHGQQYQWLTTIFYLTYLVGEFPSTWLLQKYNMGRVLTLYMVGWSICLLCISACNNWSQIMALRALQGFFECNITPGFLMITGAWYRTDEHANRSLFWQSSQGFFSIICNLMLYGIARHVTKVGGIDPWRCISLFLGGLTLLGAIFSWFVLGSPHEVKWLNEEERRMASARIMVNQMADDTAGKKWSWEQFWECFRDPQVYFGFFNTMLACIPNGGITAFSSLMYQTFGFDEWGSMLYGLPRNGMYVVVFILVAVYLQKFQNQRMWIMIVSCILPCVGMLVMSLLPNTADHKWVKWGMFDMTVVFSLALFLGWSLITSNVAGKTKRTVVSALTLISYCVGNMIGAQVFRTKDAPRYIPGTITCCVCFGAEVILIIIWRVWYMYENRRRDRLAAESGLSEEELKQIGQQLGMQDKTDLENVHFRYTM